MSETPISLLRRRMIEDMTIRNFSADTQRNYIRAVKNLAIFLGRSPDTATPEDLRLFQLHLTENRVRPPTINATVSAVRFFFNVTVDRPDVTRPLTSVAEPRKIPVVLNPDEVVRFLEAAPGPKYKAAFGAAYGAGLRVSEVAALKVSDIDSQRMMIRVEQDKGRLGLISRRPRILQSFQNCHSSSRVGGRCCSTTSLISATSSSRNASTRAGRKRLDHPGRVHHHDLDLVDLGAAALDQLRRAHQSSPAWIADCRRPGAARTGAFALSRSRACQAGAARARAASARLDPSAAARGAG